MANTSRMMAWSSRPSMKHPALKPEGQRGKRKTIDKMLSAKAKKSIVLKGGTIPTASAKSAPAKKAAKAAPVAKPKFTAAKAKPAAKTQRVEKAKRGARKAKAAKPKRR